MPMAANCTFAASEFRCIPEMGILDSEWEDQRENSLDKVQLSRFATDEAALFHRVGKSYP